MARAPQTARDRGRESESAFLREVVLRGPVSRSEIAPRIGLDPAQVSRIARRMIDFGLVRERPEAPDEGPVRPGGRSRPLTVDPRGGQVLGIVIAPTVQTVALADIGRNVIGSADFQFEPVADAEGLVLRLAEECRRLTGAHAPDRSRLLGGFVMITAEVNPETGDVWGAPYLGWGAFPLRAQLEALLGVPMEVRMLAATIGRAEVLFGAARGRGDVLAMLCGVGVGAAVLIDGRYVGATRFPGGPIGRMTVVAEDGATAMVDEAAGGVGILRRLLGERIALAPLSHIDLDLHDAIERDRAGDPRVAGLMTGAGRALGRLAAQHAQFVRPEIVLVSGPLAMSPSYMAGIRVALSEAVTPPIEVAASRVTGPEGGNWATCSMAVYEYLVERPLDLQPV
ncbi:MAG: ROK family protein [Defluviicoccus sp.]|nr:ROK family protein [Defluviicoccus sp.]